MMQFEFSYPRYDEAEVILIALQTESLPQQKYSVNSE